MSGEEVFRVRLTETAERIFIFINEELHLMVPRSNRMCLQSWIEGKAVKRYFIEYRLEDGLAIESDYDERDKWSAVLRAWAGFGGLIL